MTFFYPKNCTFCTIKNENDIVNEVESRQFKLKKMKVNKQKQKTLF